MSTNTMLEEMILNSQGLRGIKNRAITSALNYFTDKTKRRFGIEMDFKDSETGIIIEWLKNHDPKFKDHISNPYIDLNKSKDVPKIDNDFIIKLEKATYLFVSGRLSKDKDGDKETQELHLYIFGKKSYKYFRNISKYIESERNRKNYLFNVSASSSSNGSYWTSIASKLAPRTMDSLFFDNNVKNIVINHLNQWQASEQIYSERGLIFKTGILLYGNAGTGKSTMANAIANYLGCNLINVDTPSFNHLNISEFVQSVEADQCLYVILLDEIDTIFGSREDQITDKQKENITKLLTLLDSPKSPSNVVFVATTNYFDRLDKSLLRKGRFDITLNLSDISRSTAVEMCHGFKLSDDKIESIINKCEFPVNPATLQSMILDIM